MKSDSQDGVISRLVVRHSLQHSVVFAISPVDPWVVLPVSDTLAFLKQIKEHNTHKKHIYKRKIEVPHVYTEILASEVLNLHRG